MIRRKLVGRTCLVGFPCCQGAVNRLLIAFGVITGLMASKVEFVEVAMAILPRSRAVVKAPVKPHLRLKIAVGLFRHAKQYGGMRRMRQEESELKFITKVLWNGRGGLRRLTRFTLPQRMQRPSWGRSLQTACVLLSFWQFWFWLP